MHYRFIDKQASNKLRVFLFIKLTLRKLPMVSGKDIRIFLEIDRRSSRISWPTVPSESQNQLNIKTAKDCMNFAYHNDRETYKAWNE